MSTPKEIQFSPEELIISKTDTNGNITYANRLFMRVCNYSEDELLGKPHNMIRHPDMPKGVFHGMWESLRAGKEFFGFIKNSTADGNYYWVFANVTPDFEDGRIVGYYSVRRYAPRSALTAVQDIYSRMIQLEHSSDKASAARNSWQWLTDYCASQPGQAYDAFILTHYQNNK